MLDSALMTLPVKQFHRFLVSTFQPVIKTEKRYLPFWGGTSGECYLLHNSLIQIISAYLYALDNPLFLYSLLLSGF